MISRVRRKANVNLSLYFTFCGRSNRGGGKIGTMRDDDRPTSKRESQFSPSYSHLPPREIFIYDKEDEDVPMDAAATPARDNLSTKTTDITEPEIPNVPRTNGQIAKKFTFDLLSPTDEQDVEDDDRNVENENADSEKEDRSSQTCDQSQENMEQSTSEQDLDSEGAKRGTGMENNDPKQANCYLCGFEEAPFDEDPMIVDDQNLGSSSVVDKTDVAWSTGGESLIEDEDKIVTSEAKESMCGAILAESESEEEEDNMPTVEPEVTENLVDAPSDELENRHSAKSTENMDALKQFEEVCCLKLESFRFC